MNSASKVEYDQIQIPAAVARAVNKGASDGAFSSASGADASVSGAAAANGGAPACGCSWNCENFFVSDYGEKMLRQHAPGAGGDKTQGGGGKGAEAIQTSVVTAPSYAGCCRACRSAKVLLRVLCRWIGRCECGSEGGRRVWVWVWMWVWVCQCDGGRKPRHRASPFVCVSVCVCAGAVQGFFLR